MNRERLSPRIAISAAPRSPPLNICVKEFLMGGTKAFSGYTAASIAWRPSVLFKPRAALRAMRTFVITAHTSVTFSTNDLRKLIPMVQSPRSSDRASIKTGKYAMFVDRIKSPRCPQCGAMMSLRIIEPERPGFDSRTFECPKCYDTETFVASISHEINVSIGPA
jgi:hypothetical protein